MCGIGTTLVEAMHLGRKAVGVDGKPRWAEVAVGNLALAEAFGATGTGEVHAGDARALGSLMPASIRGRVALVLTSPPYGSCRSLTSPSIRHEREDVLRRRPRRVVAQGGGLVDRLQARYRPRLLREKSRYDSC